MMDDNRYPNVGRLGGGPWEVVLEGDLVESSNVSLDASSMITEGE